MTTETDVKRLEDRLAKLEAQEAKLREQLAQAEIDQWQGRVEDVELQLHLGTLELQDRVGPLFEALRDRWLDAQAQLGDGANTATDVIDTVRAGLEQAMRDLRRAIVDAAKIATGS